MLFKSDVLTLDYIDKNVDSFFYYYYKKKSYFIQCNPLQCNPL